MSKNIVTINLNGKTYENRTENLKNWYNFTSEQKTTIETKHGKPIYLVRQIFDANGQKMTKGQKTLCVFEFGAIVDKTTLNKLAGIDIAERKTAASAAKRAAAIAALVAVGFDETTAAATVDRQGK